MGQAQTGDSGWLERHAGLLVALLAALASIPFLNTVWLLADEGIWLHAAKRMLDGQALYRDFFEFHPPVGFLMITAWLKLFGTSLVSARSLMLLVTSVTAWCTFTCCRIASGRTWLSAVFTLMWVVAGQGMWTQVNHHWFTTMFSMIALFGALSPEQRGATAIAGVAASLAALVTTHRGGLVVISAFVGMLLDRQVHRLAVYVGAGLTCAALVLGYLVAESTVVAAFEQVVLYAMNHYSGIQAVPFGSFASLQFLPVLAIYPLIAILLLNCLWQDWRSLLRQRQLGTLGMFAIAGLAGSFPRPDAVHIAFAAALALPLLAALLALAIPPKRPLTILMAVLACGMTFLPWCGAVKATYDAAPVTSATGVIKVLQRDGTAELVAYLSGTPEEKRVFFYPYDPLLPFLTDTNHPAKIDILVPEYSTPQQYRETCEQIMKSADLVVIDHEITTASFYRAVFPAMRNPAGTPEKLAFEDAIQRSFDVKQKVGSFLILRRRDATVKNCQLIASSEGPSHD